VKLKLYFHAFTLCGFFYASDRWRYSLNILYLSCTILYSDAREPKGLIKKALLRLHSFHTLNLVCVRVCGVRLTSTAIVSCNISIVVSSPRVTHFISLYYYRYNKRHQSRRSKFFNYLFCIYNHYSSRC